MLRNSKFRGSENLVTLYGVIKVFKWPLRERGRPTGWLEIEPTVELVDDIL